MTRTLDTVVGLDIGTTTSKALIRRLDDGHVLVAEQDTPWRVSDLGTDADPRLLLRTAVDLIGRSVAGAVSTWGSVTVRAISVTGLAESGVLLDPHGHPAAPAIAWFDRRGERELDALGRRLPELAGEFPAVTGLPWSFQASFAKLLWHGSTAPVPRGSTWLSVPEWIVHALGGTRLREASLASRTGLIAQRTGAPWGRVLDLVGLPESFLPEAAAAGTPAGRLTHDALPAAAAGALLSIAGHDHPVAAVAVGAVGPGELFNSSGTADVLARAVPSTLSDADRAAIVAAGWSAGRHVVPDTDLLLAGGSGGLLLRRVLKALGAAAPAARDSLDTASLQVGTLPSGLVVRGDGRHQQDVELRFTDDATPAAIWTAATRYTASLAGQMLADVEPIVGAHRWGVAAGGWTRMASVRRAKTEAIGALDFSDVRQPGATGAAMFAEYSLSAHSQSLTQFLHDAPAFAGA